METDKFLVLYGSETGTAQDVAERIWRDIKMLGLKGPVLAMDDYQICNLPHERLAIFVCSTTGQGDQPTNMKNFWRFLLRKNLPLNSLQNLSFAVLGLGDSSYVKFNYAGKKLFRRLEMLGGRVLLDPGWADDQHDLGADAVVDPWIASLLQNIVKLHPYLTVPDTPPPLLSKWDVKTKIITNSEDEEKYRLCWPISPSEQNVKLVSNIRTTPQQHFQDVRVVKLERLDSELTYNSGDVAVLRPNNSEESVMNLMKVLPHINPEDILTIVQRDEDMPVPRHLSNPVSFLQLATYYWDLCAVPRRSVLDVLSRMLLDEESSPELEIEREKLAELSSSQGQEDYFSYCTRPRRTIVELLQDFPHTSATISPSFLFDIFQPIRPRMFSIASPPQGNYLELLVAVVRYKTRLVKPRLGLCSNWLASLKLGSVIRVHIKSGSLVFPKQGHLIMVGPGTGLAPFRNYICSEDFERLTKKTLSEINETSLNSIVPGDRPSIKNQPPATLIFGCRNRAADFHFRDDLMNKSGLNLITAFSRDQPHKIYVQHVITEKNDYFGQLLCREDTNVMVAGNAKDMPEAVRQAFISCLVTTQSMTKDQAESLIESMEAKGRYQTETWS